MSKHHSFYNTVDQIVTYGINKGILHLFTGHDAFNGITIRIHNKPVLNFGSCSYLGLEFDERIKQAAIEAIRQYGTQFSESRAYVSLGLYRELNNLLDKIFDAPCVITPTTTLGHIANIPVMVEDDHAVILDQQVHNSVQTAVQLVKARGVHIELLRHNRMDLLEERIIALRDKYKTIWYMADGIYSMFGDTTPVDALYALMDKYPALHFYVDDAHGMSIHGKYGRGYVLSKHAIHPKMVMATSLNKAFATGGGLLVYGNAELARKVGTVGGPLLSSGPMQPSALGAAIASAHIHLSEELIEMQAALRRNLVFTSSMLLKYKLPVISEAGAAIFFVGVSLPKLGHHIVKKMLDAGYYVNLGVFPTVPMKQTGIRFTITRLHTFAQIENMIATLAAVFPQAMKQENIQLEDIYKAFKKLPPAVPETAPATAPPKAHSLQSNRYHSIEDISPKVWDACFAGKGNFDWLALQTMEAAFQNNTLPEDNWIFDYLIIKDETGRIVLATFFTTAIWKDDMLSPKNISAAAEQKRTEDPYWLSTTTLCSGSLISEGEHLYINREHAQWQQAMLLLLEVAYSLQQERQAGNIVLRDFHAEVPALEQLLLDNGFIRLQMPDTHIIPSLHYKTAAAFYQQLSANSRNQLRKKVLRNQPLFDVSFSNAALDDAALQHAYQLYLAVKNKSLELNSFALPLAFFKAMENNPNWEMMSLQLKGDDKPCCVVFCYQSASVYMPMIIGLNYTSNSQYNVYRQALYQLVLRAMAVDKKQLMFGFAAPEEKQKLGAIAIKTFAWLHASDTFHAEILAALPAMEKAALMS